MSAAKEYPLELNRLKGTLLFAAITLLLSVIFLLLTSVYLQKKNVEANEIDGQLLKMQNLLTEERAIQGTIESYQHRFEQLNQLGYFGSDQKLIWLEVVKSASATLTLPSIRYDIGHSTRVANDSHQISTDLGVYETAVNLRLGLLHEGDLLALTHYLEQAGLGLFSLEQCSVVRMSDTLPKSKEETLLNASCQFNSYQFVFNDPASDDPINVAMQ